MKYTIRQSLCEHVLTLFYTLLCVVGCIGCVVTGFSVPVYPQVLYTGLVFLCVLLLLFDLRPMRLRWFRPAAYVLLIGGMGLYLNLRMEEILYGLCFIAVYVFRWLCFGYSGLSMPSFLSFFEEQLLGAAGIPGEEARLVALMTEALLFAGFVIGGLYSILRSFSVGIAALLPLPFFVLCFFVISATVPAPWVITFLLLFWLLTLFTGVSQRRNPTAAVLQTLVLVVPALLLFSFVGNVFPRENTVRAQLQETYDRVLLTLSDIWDRVRGGNELSGIFTVSVEGDEIAFSSLGKRSYSGRIVMHAESDTPGIYYLRQNTYNRYTAQGWSYTDAAGTGADGDVLRASAEILRAHGAPAAALTLTGARADLLFTPYYFETTTVPHTFHLDRNLKNTARESSYAVSLYRFSGVFTDINGDSGQLDMLRDELSAYLAKNAELYTQIHPETAIALRKYLRENGISDETPEPRAMWETVSDITGLVRGAAAYSLDAPLPPEDEDFVSWFLSEAETGYCTYFATAEVMLLRAVGIPARMAVGFLVDIGEAGRETPVRDSSAHAWAEVFDTRLGWIPIEATPPAGGTGSAEVSGADTTPPENDPPAEETTPPPQSDTTAPDVTEQEPDKPDTAPAGSGDGAGSGSNGSDGTSGTGGISSAGQSSMTVGIRVLLLFGAVFGVGVLLFIAAHRYRAYRLAQIYDGRPGGSVRDALSALPPENAAALYLYRRCISMTALLGEKLDPALEMLAEKARFSQYTLTGAELARFRSAYKQYADALKTRDSTNLYKRFVHQWVDVYY